MTTIACNLREMAGDTRACADDIGTDRYSTLKLFAANGALYGIQGSDCSGQGFAVEWLRAGAIVANRPSSPPKDADWHILELSRAGIAYWNTRMEHEPLLESSMAIGSGRKVALYCMRVLGMSPAQAVAEACKVDNYSGMPVYVVTLANQTVRAWNGKKGRRK